MSTGRKRQGVKQPGVWRGAWVVCPSSRKEQNENTTALKSVAPTGLGEREILFTLCGASLPGDIESQRRVQRENSAFAKRKREKIHHGGSELFVPHPPPSPTNSPSPGRGSEGESLSQLNPITQGLSAVSLPSADPMKRSYERTPTTRSSEYSNVRTAWSSELELSTGLQVVSHCRT